MKKPVLAQIIPFRRPEKVFLQEIVTNEMVPLKSFGKMMAYLQNQVPEYRKDLQMGRVRLDLIFVDELFVGTLYAETPGFPLIVRGECERSCVIGLAQWVASLPKIDPGKITPIKGITPRFIYPVPGLD